MSMREFPSSGYVVPLKALRPHIAAHSLDSFDEGVEEGDYERIMEALTNGLHGGFPPVEAVYCPNDTDTINEPLVLGEYFAIFADSDLFKRVPTRQHNALIDAGIKPEFTNWSVYG